MTTTTRGRKAAPAPEAHTDVLDGAALAQDSAALTELGRRSADIAERYGDGLPYDRSRVITQARFYMAQSAEAMFELGKLLIQLKENEPHGEFVEIVEERLGINARSAQKMMQAAVKFSAPMLASKASAPTLLGLGKAKLFELMAEPDDAIEALADGGTVAGLQIDEIEAMSSRELRAALRKEREQRAKDAKAKQAVIDKKSKKLDELEEQLAFRNTAEPSELETHQVNGARDASLEAELALRRLVGETAATLRSPATETAATAARQAAEYVAQVFAQLLADAELPVQFTELVVPEWHQPAGKAKKS